MRIPSGKTDQSIYFVAYDSADHTTRKTGLSSFTVYRSRNAGTATVYTTPTVTELDSANMPGVYALAIDEDTTVGSSSDSEEYCLHITKTGMDPVTRTIELYRRDTTSGRTLDVSTGGEAGLDWDNIGSPTTTVNLSGTTVGTVTSSGGGPTAADIADAVWDEDATAHQTQGTFGQAIGDPGATASSIWGLANTNLNATVSSRLASASISLSGGAVTVGTNNDKTGYTASTVSDKTGYSLTQSFPSNFSSLAISGGGAVTAGTVSDKTGYTVSTVGDKTGYALTSAYDPAKTAAQAGDAMTLTGAYDAAKTASQAGDAMALTSSERNSTADALLDRADAIETAWTLRKALRIVLSALGGKASGLGTTTAVFRNATDSKDRITATVDTNGNRSAVTLDGT